MARREMIKEGRIPLHTLRADIDYAIAEAHTTYGRIGIKVWICKGEVYGKVELTPNVESATAGNAREKSMPARPNNRPQRGNRNNRGPRKARSRSPLARSSQARKAKSSLRGRLRQQPRRTSSGSPRNRMPAKHPDPQRFPRRNRMASPSPPRKPISRRRRPLGLPRPPRFLNLRRPDRDRSSGNPNRSQWRPPR